MQLLTRFSLEHPRITLSSLTLVTMLLAAGLPRLQHAYGYTAIIGAHHPVVQTIRDMVDQFGGGMPARIHWRCGDGAPCASVFDDASLEMAHSLSLRLKAAPGIHDVYGIDSAGLLVPTADGFAVRRLVEQGVPAADASELAPIALRDPSWANALISRDLEAGTLYVVSQNEDYESQRAAVAAIDAALLPFRAGGFQFYVTGGPVDGVVAGRDLSESTARIIPLTVLLMALVLFYMCRSWRDVVVSLGTMGVALLWTFGVLAWLGWPQDGILEVLAPLVMVVGVCDAVHVLSRYAERSSESRADSAEARRTRLLEVAGEVGGPCFITTATTAAAFLSFTASNLASFQRFGAISAFGVTACLVLTFSLLPMATAWLPRSAAAPEAVRRTQRSWRRWLGALLRLSERHTAAVLIASAALLLAGAIGWYAHLRVDTDWLESMGEDSPVVQARRFEARHGLPTNNLEIELTLPSGTRIESPDTLARVQAFEESILSFASVLETRSIVPLVARLNRLLHDDDPAFERVGDSLAANAEILELIAFDDPDMLRVWLNLDQTRLRVTVSNRDGSAEQQGDLIRAVQAFASDQLGADWGIRMSGSVAVDYEWTREVQQTQVLSFPIALALVFAILTLFLRSPGLALAGTVPAVLPIVVTLGAMGWAGTTLDMGRAMIAAVLLGLAVDDSIHMLRHYQARRLAGDDPREAIRSAVLQVGRAIVTTSLSLSLGFLALAASAWYSIASFGLFVSLAILAALAAALVVLPALIFAWAPPLTDMERREDTAQRSGSETGLKSQAAPATQRP